MRKGIIVVSFGTSFPEVRERCIESIENKIASSFEDCEVVRAFTSYRIIEKLKNRDQLYVNTVDQALNDFFQRGITTIHVQPLHMIPGFEYEKVTRAVNEWKKSGMDITLGKTLLHDDESIAFLAREIADLMPVGQTNEVSVLMGHGTEHKANEQYAKFQKAISSIRNDVLIANVEGYPELDDIVEDIKDYSTMNLRPLMIVAGDHAMNDMAGNDEDSWASILTSQGKRVNPILRGLGEETFVQERFVQMIKMNRKW